MTVVCMAAPLLAGSSVRGLGHDVADSTALNDRESRTGPILFYGWARAVVVNLTAHLGRRSIA